MSFLSCKRTLQTVAIAILLFLCGCHLYRGAKSDPGLIIVDDSFPKWCVPMKIEFNDSLKMGTACGETLPLCEKVREMAKKVGGMGGIKSVGDCFPLSNAPKAASTAVE